MSDIAILNTECPYCRTKYALPAAGVPPGGCSLRCVRCRHNWFQTPADMELQAAGAVVRQDPPPTGHHHPKSPPPPSTPRRTRKKKKTAPGIGAILFKMMGPAPELEKVQTSGFFWVLWIFATLALGAICVLLFQEPLVAEYPELGQVLQFIMQGASPPSG